MINQGQTQYKKWEVFYPTDAYYINRAAVFILKTQLPFNPQTTTKSQQTIH